MADLTERGNLYSETRDTLRNIEGSVLVVTPIAALVEELIHAGFDIEAPLSVRVLAPESVLKMVRERFASATYAAELTAREELTLRASNVEPGSSLFVTDDSVTGMLLASQNGVAVSVDSTPFVHRAHEFYEKRWEEADSFPLRTPSLSAMQETVREQIGHDVERELTDAIHESGVVRAGEVDKVMLCLTIAARYGILQYDISGWAEEVGLASKATFSRTKMELEEKGIVRTEKVPMDVGRPRHRLRPGDERVAQGTVLEVLKFVEKQL